MAVNAQYNVAAPGSLPVRIAGLQRRKMFEAFLAIGVEAADTILDVGATADRSYDHSNYLEAWYAHRGRITALGIDAGAAFLATEFPGVRYVRGDGRSLPFADRSFDYVHSAAVLEHVGSAEQQTAFITEACRVACKGVFITTPSRWFPIEFHSVLPLVHWLPPSLFRDVLRAMGHEALAREANLNLVSAARLGAMARRGGVVGDWRIGGVRLCGLVSNLLFVLHKSSAITSAIK